MYVRTHKARWILRVIPQEEPLNLQGTVKTGYGVGESEREPAVPPRPRNRQGTDYDVGESKREPAVPPRGVYTYI